MDQEELKRIADLYAAMSDSELEKIASESGELTEEALSVLHREISKRNLRDPKIEGSQPQPQVFIEPEFQEWVHLQHYRDLAQADIARSALESAGITSMLVDDNILRMDWFYSNAIGGVKLKVKPEDSADALQVLQESIPAEFTYDETSRFEQPKCPRCNSLDISFESLNKPFAYLTMWLGFPLPLRSEKWVCNSCDARWVEDRTVGIVAHKYPRMSLQ